MITTVRPPVVVPAAGDIEEIRGLGIGPYEKTCAFSVIAMIRRCGDVVSLNAKPVQPTAGNPELLHVTPRSIDICGLLPYDAAIMTIPSSDIPPNTA